MSENRRSWSAEVPLKNPTGACQTLCIQFADSTHLRPPFCGVVRDELDDDSDGEEDKREDAHRLPLALNAVDGGHLLQLTL